MTTRYHWFDNPGDDLRSATQTTGGTGSAEPPVTAGTTGQYYRGDKSWQTLDKTAVGLPNVDNTSDVNKPVSTAQAAANTAVQAAAAADATTKANTAQASIGSNLRLPKYPATTVVSRFQSGHGFTGSTGFVTADTDFVFGSQGVKIPTNGAGATFQISKTTLSVDTTGKQILLWLKYENIAHINTTTFVLATDSGFVNTYTWTIMAATIQASAEYFTEGDWVPVVLNFANAVSAGAPTRTGIVAAKLTVRDDSAGVVTVHWNDFELVPEPATLFPNGIVSICFDDSWGSFWTQAKSVLDANNLRATHFPIQDLVGQAGRMTSAQYDLLQSQGHEINAHMNTAADHTSTFTGLSAAALEADMRAQVTAIRGFGWRGQGTAYPSGVFGLTTDAQSTIPITKRYFGYARTTSRRLMETFPPPAPFRLRAQSSISSAAGGYAATNLTTTTTGDIDRAVANKAWLILVFHNIVTGTPAASTECSVADFTSIINKVVSAGATVAPIGEVLSYYG